MSSGRVNEQYSEAAHYFDRLDCLVDSKMMIHDFVCCCLTNLNLWKNYSLEKQTKASMCSLRVIIPLTQKHWYEKIIHALKKNKLLKSDGHEHMSERLGKKEDDKSEHETLKITEDFIRKLMFSTYLSLLLDHRAAETLRGRRGEYVTRTGTELLFFVIARGRDHLSLFLRLHGGGLATELICGYLHVGVRHVL